MAREEDVAWGMMVLVSFALGIIVGAVLWAPASTWEPPAGSPPQVGNQDPSGYCEEYCERQEQGWAALVGGVASWPACLWVVVAWFAATVAFTLLVGHVASADSDLLWMAGSWAVFGGVAATCGVWGPLAGLMELLKWWLTLGTWCAVGFAAWLLVGTHRTRATEARTRRSEAERLREWQERRDRDVWGPEAARRAAVRRAQREKTKKEWEWAEREATEWETDGGFIVGV